MTPLLVARNVALANRLLPTDFTLDRGELACLIGPNGSGKTSLLHALAGIGAPSGEVTIDGKDPGALHPDARRRLFAFLPASRDISWPLSAAAVVALGLPSEAESAEVDQTLSDLGLAEMAQRRIDRMSTGERSRVLIGRALVAKPQMLLLDEPVSNLDPLWQLRLMNKLCALARERGRGVLVAVHDLDLAGRYADRLIIMHEGRIAAAGKPGDLLDGPHMPAIFGIRRSGGRWQAAT